MKKLRRTAAAVLLFILILTLTACGASKNVSYYSKDGGADTVVNKAPFADPASRTEAVDQSVTTPADPSASPAAAGTKFIYTGQISAQTQDLNGAVARVTELVRSLGGYLEGTNIREYDSGRAASLTVRVPHDKFETLMEQISGDGACQVTSRSTSRENISEQYYDLTARIANLTAKQTRLRELLAQAEKLEDVLLIEGQLSDTEYQIEKLTSQKNHYDSAVDYSTVTVELREVRTYTESVGPVSNWDRIKAAFSEGASQFLDDAADFVIWIAEHLFVLAVLLVLVIVLILLIRGGKGSRARRAEKRAAREAARQASRERAAQLRAKKNAPAEPETKPVYLSPAPEEEKKTAPENEMPVD